jgi:hypothetical protein
LVAVDFPGAVIVSPEVGGNATGRGEITAANLAGYLRLPAGLAAGPRYGLSVLE